jgi:hypothetical protein
MIPPPPSFPRRFFSSLPLRSPSHRPMLPRSSTHSHFFFFFGVHIGVQWPWSLRALAVLGQVQKSERGRDRRIQT